MEQSCYVERGIRDQSNLAFVAEELGIIPEQLTRRLVCADFAN